MFLRVQEPASSSMKPSCSARGWWSSPSRDKGQELHGELQADCQNRATVVAFPRQSAAAGDISMHPWSQAPESLPGGRGCEESLSTTRRSKSDLSETGCALPRWQEADKANQADVQQSNPIHDFIATNNNHQVGTTYSQSPDRSPSVRSHPGSSVCSAPVSAACSVTSAQKRVGDCGMQVSHISRSGGAPR